MRRKARPGRQKIIDAFVKLMADRDTDDIPVKLLVSKAGVNPSTFYYNFRDIASVADSLIDQFSQSYLRFFGSLRDGASYVVSDGNNPVTDATNAYVRFFYEHREEFVAIRKSRKYHDFEERYVREMVAWGMSFEHCFVEDDGTVVTFTPDELEYMQLSLSYTYLAYLGLWADRGFDLRPWELTDLMLRQLRLLGTREVTYRPQESDT